MATPDNRRALYWRANLRLLATLLCIWAFVSFGCGIFFADALDTIEFGGFKLGFWMSQQGSIYVFVPIIWYYVWRMNKLDPEHDLHQH